MFSLGSIKSVKLRSGSADFGSVRFGSVRLVYHSTVMRYATHTRVFNSHANLQDLFELFSYFEFALFHNKSREKSMQYAIMDVVVVCSKYV